MRLSSISFGLFGMLGFVVASSALSPTSAFGLGESAGGGG
jgi:hypothetical protein